MERKIGEIFTDGDVTLKVEKGTECFHCYYYLNQLCCDKPDLECRYDYREDRTSIVFIKHNPNDNT